MKDETVDRRLFLCRAAKATAWSGLFLVAGLPLACGEEPKETDSGRSNDQGNSEHSGTSGGSDGTEASTEGEGTGVDDPCGDVSGLTEGDLSDREDVAYVPVTADPKKRCDNCELWIVPEGSSPCGGCDILAGPIHPNGYCDVWVPVEG